MNKYEIKMNPKPIKFILLASLALVVISFFVSPLLPPREDAPSNKKARIFVDASSNNFPPMNSLDKDGNLIGFGRDIADAVAKAVGAEVKHIHSSHWIEVLEWLNSGKADFIHDTGYTKDRDEFLDYSKPIIEMNEMIFVRPNQYDITGISSLKGKKVACVNMHISHLYLKKFPEITCHIVNTPIEGLFELIAGNVDAFIYPEQITLYLAQKLRLLDKIKTTGDPLRKLTWSMVVKEGNKDLLILLNKGIDNIKQTREYERIYNKWWGRKFLAGYSESEVFMVAFIAVVISISFVSLIALFLYNHKLRSSKKALETEVLQRTQTEHDLKRSEEKYRLAMEASNDGLWDWNVETGEVFYSSAWSTILSENSVKPEYQAWESKIHPDDKADVLSSLQMHLDNKTPRWQKEHRLETKNGGWNWVLGRGRVVRRDSEGMPLRMVGTMTDITDRKETEEKIRNSEAKYRELFEQSPIGLALCQMDGQLVSINPAYADIIGYNIDEVLKLSYWDITPEKYAPDEKRQLEKIESLGSYGPYEKEYIHKDGHLVPVRLSGMVVVREGNKYIWSSVENITALKKTQREKNDLQERLRQSHKMEAIGTLAGGIAHDFNNILSAIIGYTELTQLQVPKKTKAANHLDKILIAGNRARDLVMQILTFSRQADHEFKPLSVKLIAKEALKLIRASLPSTIEIHENLISDALIMGDPTQIHQILMNLCANAGQAMQENGGRLEVTLRKEVLSITSASKYADLKPGDYLKLIVKDNGHGIPPDKLNRIFEPFFTTKEKNKGTGLGLAVAHGIVKSCKGTISASSELGTGTTFEVLLPIIKNAIKPAEQFKEFLPRGREQILFVDDEPELVYIGKQILEDLGYRVSSSTNPQKALAMFRDQPGKYDMVITDMTMPEMTGDQLAKKLFSIREDIPVMLLTGFSVGMTKEKVRDFGIRGFLMKPIIRSEMARMIRKILDEA